MQSQKTTMLSVYQEFALSDLEKGRFKSGTSAFDLFGNEQGRAADSESILALHLHRSGRSEEAAVRLRSCEARHRGLGDHARAAQCVSTAEMWVEGIDVGLKVGADPKSDA